MRSNTIERFGPVREVTHEPEQGLVFEVAFEGLQRSTRHKSGLAMRFPRISRLRWDKPPREADRLETLETNAGEDRGRPRRNCRCRVRQNAARVRQAEIVLDSTGSGDSHG